MAKAAVAAGAEEHSGTVVAEVAKEEAKDEAKQAQHVAEGHPTLTGPLTTHVTSIGALGVAPITALTLIAALGCSTNHHPNRAAC